MSQFTSPYGEYAAACVPSDITVLAQFPRVYVGGAGNVAVQDTAGNTVTFTAPPVGSMLPVRVSKVMATNTTATLMVLVW